VPGLIEQLQSDALDHDVPVSTLLGKVKVCAARLALADALAWVDAELNGYDCDGDDLPAYRRSQGITKAQDRYGRWVPMQFDDSNMARKISTIYFVEPVSSYEELLRSDSNTFAVRVDEGLVNALGSAFGVDIVAMQNIFSRSAIASIIQRVRNLVLDWSLELARAGITGDGMSFSANERKRADSAHISIGTFTGSFNTGDAAGAGATICQSYSATANDIPAIIDLIAAVRANVTEASERDAIVDAATQIAEARDKPTMLKGYERLLSAAANHMTIITPFLPAIGQMLAS
jgi:AbiTii